MVNDPRQPWGRVGGGGGRRRSLLRRGGVGKKLDVLNSSCVLAEEGLVLDDESHTRGAGTPPLHREIRSPAEGEVQRGR